MPPVGVLVSSIFFRGRTIGAPRGGPVHLRHSDDGGNALCLTRSRMTVHIQSAAGFAVMHNGFRALTSAADSLRGGLRSPASARASDANTSSRICRLKANHYLTMAIGNRCPLALTV